MVRYFIRTTSDRTLDESYSQIDYELLIDKEHNPMKSFIEQLEYLGNLDCDVVLLEDDLILCKDFKTHMEDVIKTYPNNVINFFTNPNQYFTTNETFMFCYNQCTYYPKGVSKRIAVEMRNVLLNDWYVKNNSYSTTERKALQNLKIKHIQYRPCLVQHLDTDSLMGHYLNFGRRTPYFIDYLDELNISYTDAAKPENKQKLIDLMNEKFENYSLIKLR